MSDTRMLLVKTKEGDSEARKTLIEENTGLVHHVVKRFAGRGVDMQDLFQIGCIGLIKAVDHFDMDRDVAFSTYAVPMILGEIRRFLRDDGPLKISRTIKENAYLIKKETDHFIKMNGRDPKLSEIMELTGLSREMIVESMETMHEVESIDKPLYLKDGNKISVSDRVAAPGNEKEELMNHIMIEQAMEVLDENERRIIILRYFENKTQMQVAHILGTNQVQISRSEKKILSKMRMMF
ncbi:MAG: SigB/SigF/SigG family RNA polymerase sigma factor [Lachnospiraceae bacterium]|nr:SigB/SigF/SigG family RNA polymerase sigma factor [Lachnospiraceae bacterium]